MKKGNRDVEGLMGGRFKRHYAREWAAWWRLPLVLWAAGRMGRR